jgi:hypothetical protein
MIQFSCWRFSTGTSLAFSVLNSTVNHRRCDEFLLTLDRVALWTIWRSSGLITRETKQNCEAERQEQKAILVWGEISHFSSTSRCCYWTDKWNLLLLEKGTVCHWGTRRVRTPSAENSRSWVKKMKRSQLVDFPAGLYLHWEISRGKRNCILIHFSLLHPSELCNMVW